MNLMPKKNPTTVNIGDNIVYIEKELLKDNDSIRRSDAIKAMKELSEHYTDKGREWHPHIDFVIDELIKIPAVEPCKDVVSRAAAIKEIRNAFDMGDCYCDRYSIIGRMFSLPSVTFEPKYTENIGTDYAECDQFICLECGIHLQGWVRIDEDDYDDGIVHEYEFRFCPNCGAKIRDERSRM